MTFLVLKFSFDISKELSKLAELNLYAHLALPFSTTFTFLDQELGPIGKH